MFTGFTSLSLNMFLLGKSNEVNPPNDTFDRKMKNLRFVSNRNKKDEPQPSFLACFFL